MNQFVATADQAVFAALTDRYLQRALSVAKQYVRDRHTAEDAVQEAFLRTIRSRDRYSGQKLFAPWFFRILRNVCIDIIRKRNVREKIAETLLRDQPGYAHDDSHDQPECSELLNRLPSKERAVLSLRVQQEMAFSEVAAALGCTEEAAKKRAQRGLKRLRTLLESQRVHESRNAALRYCTS